MPTPLYGGVQEQTVTPPVTERPGEAPAKGRQAAAASGVAGATGPSGASQLAGVASQNPADASVIAASMDLEKPKDKSVFYVMPRAGLGAMSSQGGYDVNARFAGGLALGVATSDYLSFELGYTYAEYGVNIASGNPFVQQLQSMQYPYGGNANANTLTLKQNVVDAGVKLHLLEPASRIRPFLGGGAAWSKGFINYDQRILNALKQNPYFANSPLTSDYEMTSYMGYLSGGLDVKMNQSITLGLMAKYYAVLSSNENSQLLNYAFYNPGYAGQAPEKQMVGGSMGKTNFFTLMAGMSFAF
jgi:outer membrane protein W